MKFDISNLFFDLTKITVPNNNIIRIAFGKQNINFTNALNFDVSINHTSINHASINHTSINNVKDETIFKIFYPKNSYSPSKLPVGGGGFFVSPTDIFLANEVIFSYQVYFDPSFKPVLGGKLPGLFIGRSRNRSDTFGASGGNSTDNASCRIAWRANFSAEAYVYLPTRTRHSDYYKIPGLVQNSKFGDSLWRSILQFNPMIWNTVSIRLKLNNIKNGIPVADGELQVTINDNTQKFNKLIWRTTDEHFINAILFETFFGGSKKEAATPNDTWSYFKNIEIQKIGL